MRECDGGWRARPGGACAARAGGIRQVAELGSTPPPFGVDDVPGLAAPWFSEPIRVEELGSQQDLNFLICGADGRRGVLKVGSPCFDHAALLLQNAAMAHVADTGLPFGTPCALPSADGRFVVSVERDGAAYDVRVLTYVEGAPLRALSVRPRWARRLLGQTAGAVSRALASFSDPAADRSFQWALDQAPAVVAAFSHDLPAFHRELVGRAMAPYEAVVPQFAGRLRRQVLHGDVTEYNVVVTRSEDGRRCAHGLIDFGDLAEGFLVGEAAVSAAAAARCEPEDALSAMTDVVQAFHEVNALEEAELAALYPLVLARTAVSAVSGARQATVTPRNAYVTDDMGRLWAALELLVEVPGALAEALWRVACGLPARRQRRLDLRSLAARARPVVDLGGRTAFAVDLSAGSDGFRFGGWRTEAGIRGAVEAPEGSVAAGRFGEARLPYGEPGPEEPATLHLGVDLFVHAGTPVRAPLAGKIERVASRSIVLRHEGLDEGAIWVRIAGLTPTVSVGEALPAGGNLGAVAEAPDRLPSHVHVQLAMDAVGEPPGLVRPSLGAAWLAICPDPSPLLGIDAAAPADTSGQVLARRRRYVASAQQLYFEQPLEISRGWRHFLFDRHARAYLDMVNNVAVVGHSHPGVADAAARQMRLLNTNSRFLFDSMGRFAERLVALVPSPLDTVFLVNSGSEANELALRLARTATGRRDVVAVQGAYHGWTGAIHGLNTSPFYPEALRNPEPWLRVVAAPNPYRGAFGADVPDAGARYADHVKAACDAAAESGPGVAAFLSEPQLGNAGGVLTPQGYLETAYRHVRDAGGLCVADEVQVGYARLGRWFWAFEEQGVVPDIVTIAKPAGNGHPIGAVITTREISERFRRQATLFSSAGGGPVSCEIGIAVLDAIRDEGLQANARLVGDVLRCGLNQLADRHELIGAIHGTGLHLGVELVRDRATKTPATAEASWICERMLELGVIVRPTGDFSNVIKVKPPLCVDEAATELFLSAFDRTLAEGPPRSAEETPR